MGIWQWLKEHRIDQTEDGSCRPNTQRQRTYGEQRESGIPADAPRGLQHFGEHILILNPWIT